MKKYLFALAALLTITTQSHAQNFLNIYHNGKVVSSVEVADVDSMVIGTDKENRTLDLYRNGESFHHTLIANVDSIKVIRHDYVDLGLPSGTLWATCNIGASSPEDYGDYFAWGETEGYNSGKTDFSWSTYKWCNGTYSSLTKYNTSSSHGTVDNKTKLDLEDDAAYVNWGPAWCMPSYEQFDELINSSYTTTEWTTLNGVYGFKITSKSNGNSIFLSAAGDRFEGYLFDAGSKGFYWSDTLLLTTDDPFYVNGLFFSSWIFSTGSNYRCCGQSVRPVRLSE